MLFNPNVVNTELIEKDYQNYYYFKVISIYRKSLLKKLPTINLTIFKKRKKSKINFILLKTNRTKLISNIILYEFLYNTTKNNKVYKAMEEGEKVEK